VLATGCQSGTTADDQLAPFSALDAGVDIGHVHLKVSDLDRSVVFYRDVLGLTLQGRMGDRAAFFSAGDDYHHHLGLNTFKSLGGGPPAPGTTGLYHVAFRYRSQAALARALRRLQSHGVELSAATTTGSTRRRT
jgi:catechol 2,3-dioxygenase